MDWRCLIKLFSAICRIFGEEDLFLKGILVLPLCKKKFLTLNPSTIFSTIKNGVDRLFIFFFIKTLQGGGCLFLRGLTIWAGHCRLFLNPTYNNHQKHIIIFSFAIWGITLESLINFIRNIKDFLTQDHVDF